MPDAILLVDDEPSVLSALTRALRSERYEVHAELSGELALERMRSQPFKVVISVNGAKGGAPIESTVGRVDLYVVVHPAAAMTVPTITV